MIIIQLDEHGGPPEAPYRLTAVISRRNRPTRAVTLDQATRAQADLIVRTAFQRERER